MQPIINEININNIDDYDKSQIINIKKKIQWEKFLHQYHYVLKY